MKVIFLDFDGVVNDLDRNCLVNEVYVEALRKIICATNALVVVSSARKNEFMADETVEYRKSFYYHNFLLPLKRMSIEVYDYTPFVDVARKVRRETEIEAYLLAHPEIEQFVILDDEGVLTKFESHQVFIEYSNGLREEHILPAIAILNGNLGFYPPEYDKSEPFLHRLRRVFAYREKSKKS